MSLKSIYYCILTAIVIVAMYHIFAVGRFNYPEFRIKAGQVAEFELLAPFDFPVLKSEEQLAVEQEKRISELKKPYTPSEEVVFTSFRVLDDIFSVLNRSNDEAMASELLSKKGYEFSTSALKPLLSTTTREEAYNSISAMLQAIYQSGVYGSIEADTIYLYRENVLRDVPKRDFVSLNDALTRFNLAFRNTLWSPFAQEIATLVIRENLFVDENKFSELSEQIVSNLTLTEGFILKNEVIIRKNARVTDNDIVRLQSLQEAYRNKNISKSPWQQILLTLGLLIFNLIIVFAVSYYFHLQTKEDAYIDTDIMPIHIGFVFIVLLAIINNLFLGYNNILIPFALMVLAATILVGMEFGVFYCIGSFLMISPFINWETYTPVIFILSTILTIVMIKKLNAFHEYFTIWFYLTLSSVIVGMTIAIYKNDPLVVLLKNSGLQVISSTLSVIGIMLIVPLLERKWNRATKQTLLELLDFNHPLLKKLATDAVGTYHHSLIVGNLTERAAESIGANPLLARVGSYYHDIGKIANTQIFTENNEDSSSIHANHSPEESAALIKHHVFDGIELARKYKIPRPVIDIIMQHHGTGYIRYFLDAAEKQGIDINPVDFRYPGPKPQTKEAVLVMLADMVESTAKSKNILNEQDLIKIIDDTMYRLIREGQLDEAPISLNELRAVKESMLPVLESIYRKRLEYPEQKENV